MDYRPHKIAARDCSCGFYAYFGERRVNHTSDYSVLGVIEGYGRVTFGQFGFRAEKAKILALYNPHAKESDANPKSQRFHAIRSLAGNLKFEMSVLALYTAVSTTRIFLYDHLALNIVGWVLWAIWFVSFCAGFVVRRRLRKNLRAQASMERLLAISQGNYSHLDKCGSEISKEVYREIQKKYPSIPMYRTVEAMVEAYPPTVHAELSEIARQAE